MSTAITLSPNPKPVLNLDALRGVSPQDKAAVASVFDDLAGAADKIRRAGLRWMNLSEELRAKVMKELPGYMVPFMQRLERVGSGSLHPQLYAVGGRAAAALGRLPLDQQELYLTEQIPVAITRGDGRPDVRRMDVADMGQTEWLQVFERRPDRSVSVRTIAQQRAWLAEQAVTKKAGRIVAGAIKVDKPGRWRVQGTRAFPDPVKVKTGFTRQDLIQMIKDIDG